MFNVLSRLGLIQSSKQPAESDLLKLMNQAFKENNKKIKINKFDYVPSKNFIDLSGIWEYSKDHSASGLVSIYFEPFSAGYNADFSERQGGYAREIISCVKTFRELFLEKFPDQKLPEIKTKISIS